MICSAACLPSWIAGWASCGEGFFSSSAMSPVAKIRSLPWMRRSEPTSSRPPFADGAMGGHPAGPDREVAPVRGAVREDHLIPGDLADGGVQPEVHAAL